MTTTAIPTTTGIPLRALEDLRRRVAGDLHTPADPTWDAVRTPWALSVDQHPLAVVEVRDVADVQAATRWAADHDLQVTAQPSGHGASDDLAGVLLLRTRALGGITIDVDRRTVRVGAGVKAGELLAALDGTGLTFLSGSNPDPSVVGLTIGGGMSWFGRAYGIGANAIVSVDLVDGLGRIRHVTQHGDPELFWAVRGGGGDFGIVTAIELAAVPRGVDLRGPTAVAHCADAGGAVDVSHRHRVGTRRTDRVVSHLSLPAPSDGSGTAARQGICLRGGGLPGRAGGRAGPA